MFYKRTLILSDVSKSGSDKKGVITLESFEQGVKGQLRLYNFGEKPQNVAIGISTADEVFKVPIKPIDNIVDFRIDKKINLQEKISCGLVDISKALRPQMIIGGTSNYLNDWADRVEQAFACDIKTLSKEDMYSTNEQEIEQEIETVLRQDKEYIDCSMCQKCKYKQAFFEKEIDATADERPPKIEPIRSENIQKIEEILALATNLDENVEQNVEEKQDANPDEKETNKADSKEKPQENIPDFYDQIKDQIDDLFKNHLRDENLESIIPNSKWVRVEYDDMPGHYVMGLVYDEDSLQFISYGLPANDSSEPPKDLVEFAQWLPLGQNDNKSGYWIVYQSAKTGESIKII